MDCHKGIVLFLKHNYFNNYKHAKSQELKANSPKIKNQKT